MWLHYVAAAATTNRPPPSSGLTPVATWGWLEASARCSAALPAVRGRGSSSKPPPRPLRQKPPQLENMAKHKPTQFKYKYTIAHIHKPPSQRKPGLENVFYTHHACSSTWNWLTHPKIQRKSVEAKSQSADFSFIVCWLKCPTLSLLYYTYMIFVKTLTEPNFQ